MGRLEANWVQMASLAVAHIRLGHVFLSLQQASWACSFGGSIPKPEKVCVLHILLNPI